jgi:hypothetical protein
MEGAGKQWDAEAVEVLVSEMANITALGIT